MAILRWAGLLSLILSSISFGLNIPFLSGPVVDEAGLLKPEERQAITELLRAIDASGKAQIQVLIPQSLQDEDIESYSIAVAEAWKIGKKGKDDGLIFIIAPHERKMRLEVGPGLQGVITDAVSRRILDNDIRPYFRAGRYGDGIQVAVASIARKLQLDLHPDVEPVEDSPHRPIGLGLTLLVLLFIFFVLFFGNFPGSGFGGGGWGPGGGSGGWGGGGWGGDGGGWSGGGGGFDGGGSSSSW